MNNIKIDNKMSKSGTSEKFIFVPSYYFIITKLTAYETLPTHSRHLPFDGLLV